MAEGLVQLEKVTVGLKSLVARVRIADGGPTMTSEDLVATTRVYNLMPHIIDHTCLGDAGDTFKDAMGNTEVAHLLEHVTVEIISQCKGADAITSGRTTEVPGEPRTYEVELSCPDDVLVVGALQSAVWMVNWAFAGGGEPEPDVQATVEGLNALVDGLGTAPAERYAREVGAQTTAEVERRCREAIAQRERELAERREAAEARAAEAAARARAEAERRAAERAQRRAAQLQRTQVRPQAVPAPQASPAVPSEGAVPASPAPAPQQAVPAQPDLPWDPVPQDPTASDGE